MCPFEHDIVLCCVYYVLSWHPLFQTMHRVFWIWRFDSHTYTTLYFKLIVHYVVCENGKMSANRILNLSLVTWYSSEGLLMKELVIWFYVNWIICIWCSTEFWIIYELCLYILSISQWHELIRETLATLHAFLSWIPLGYIFESPLVWTSFIILVHLYMPDCLISCIKYIGS